MNQKTKKLVYAAALLAICIVSQFLKNTSVYITGPIINACLIICELTAGLSWAVVLAVITPVTSYIITGSPIVSAIPAILPCIMIGNVIIVICVHFLRTRFGKDNVGLIVSMIIGSVAKAIFMGVVIALVLIPMLLPEPMLPKMSVFQTTFSVTQLITALIGSVIVGIVWVPLKKFLNSEE